MNTVENLLEISKYSEIKCILTLKITLADKWEKCQKAKFNFLVLKKKCEYFNKVK